MKIERSCARPADAKKARRRLRCILCSLFLAAAVVAAVEAVASPSANEESVGLSNSLPASIILVTNSNDSGPGSLRQALVDANDGDTIDATGVSGTILLTSGELQITHTVTINGPGAGNLAVSGNNTFRVFENFASNATISGLTITNGRAGSGGGILNHEGLTLSDSIVRNSFTINGGAGILSGGTLSVTNSTIVGNSTFIRPGGGIYFGAGDVSIVNSTIRNNSAATDGGGIYGAGGDVIIVNSTISGNAAETGNGGGISNTGSLAVTNSTISNNRAANSGGAIYNSGGLAQIEDTILNAGVSGGTIFNDGGTVTSLGYNLASDDGGGVLTGPGDQINTDPMLGALQDNGGPTFTHALFPGSPAIDTGNPNFTSPPFYDQRGPDFFRVNGRIDIGSFEVQAGSTPTPTPTPTATPTGTPTPTPTPTVTPTPTATPSPTPRSSPRPRPRPTPRPRP